MYLQILQYTKKNRTINRNVSKRMEFFAHYWQGIFSKPSVNFDPFYLKSHRSIIEKVKLQIDGNFDMAKGKIKYFFLDDPLFQKNDIILKSISGTPVRRSIQKLRKTVNVSGTNWPQIKKATLNSQLKTIQEWLDKKYSKSVSKCLIALLEKESPLTAKEIIQIKELSNCLIVELFNKGFTTKFIHDLPEALINPEKFPYKKMSSDFGNKEEYEKYKRETFSKLTLKKQIEAIITILSRPERERYIVFRVYDINFRIPSLILYNVEFYNPASNPKIVHRLPVRLFEETFALSPVAYELGSQCNACLKVSGIQEAQLIQRGYEKARSVLSILNKELDLHGKIYPNNSFITNARFDQIWGSTSATNRGYKPLDEVKPNQVKRLLYLNKIKLYQKKDKKVFDLFSSIAEALSDAEYYNPEKLWMILEATFGKEKEIKEFFKAVFKIYLRYNHDLIYRSHLRQKLDGLLVNPSIHYAFNNMVEAKKYAIDDSWNSYTLKKFQKKILTLPARFDTPWISDLVIQINEYHSNKSIFYPKMESYIDYIISELYAQRNLSVHSNMSDDLFLLKQKEVKGMINIFTEVFLHWYLLFPKSKSVEKTIERIKKKAAQL